MGFPGGAVVKNLPAMQETQEGVGVIPVYIHTNMWDIAHVYGVCIYIFPLFLCMVHVRKLSYLSLLFSETLHSNGYIFPFLLCLSLHTSDRKSTQRDRSQTEGIFPHNSAGIVLILGIARCWNSNDDVKPGLCSHLAHHSARLSIALV